MFMRGGRAPHPPIPAWGTPPIERAAQPGLMARMARAAGSLALALITGGIAGLSIASAAQIPPLDAVLPITLLILGGAVVVLVINGLRTLTAKGYLRVATLLSLILTAGSVCAFVLTLRYDNAHREANGQ